MDVELGNFVLGADRPAGTGAEASRALLDEIDGFPRARRHRAPSPAWTGPAYLRADLARDGRDRPDYAERSCGWQPYGLPRPAASYGASFGSSWYDPQDWGRKFLSNGACAYIDLDHLELATAETRSAFDQVAAFHALLRVGQAALAAANARRSAGRKIQALVNNSDGRGHSYGSHVNFLLTRGAWDNVFCRRLQIQLALAAFQASSIVFTGQGKVGSENGAPAAGFQISQRADFIETLSGIQTTSRRPIVNSRDEPLCGHYRTGGRDPDASAMARLHVIFFDATLCHAATLLKLGTMQIVLAMIEAGRFNGSLILDDPIDAVVTWSHDPAVEARALMADGRMLTAVETQWLFFEDAKRFVESGACADTVPRAADIVALWEEVLTRLDARDFAALSGQLDWVLKWSILRRVLDQRPGLTWESPELKHLDLLYSSLDPAEGLYWACEREELTERLVPEDRIEYLTTRPPEDTRAWTRGTLLGLAGGDAVEDADWDRLRFTTARDRRWRFPQTVHLENPLRWTRDEMQPIFDAHGGLEDILERLEARQALEPDAAAPGDERDDRRRAN
jgi:proteasome accessory factor A